MTCRCFAVLFLCLLAPSEDAIAIESVRESRASLQVMTAEEWPGKHADVPERVKQRIHELRELGMKHGHDFGYPWVDSNGIVVAPVASRKGEALVRTSHASSRSANGNERVQQVTRSWRDLEDIRNSIVDRKIQGAHPGLRSVVKLELDGEHNRVVATVTSLDASALEEALIGYGTGSVAIVVDPLFRRTRPDRGGRTSDVSPFTPGAKAAQHQGGCTFGMPWHWWQDGIRFTRGMLTAGHCYPNGGTAYMFNGTMVGHVYPGSRENWNPNFGTDFFNGYYWFAGDIALVEQPANTGHQAMMYRYDSYSGVRPIKQMWTRSSYAGDQYCVSGATTLETCGFVVRSVNQTREVGPNVWVRNVVEGVAPPGRCTRGGDSGAAVYTVRADGGIASKGIHHGSDTPEGNGPCPANGTTLFTDIWTVYYAFGGGHPTY